MKKAAIIKPIFGEALFWAVFGLLVLFWSNQSDQEFIWRWPEMHWLHFLVVPLYLIFLFQLKREGDNLLFSKLMSGGNSKHKKVKKFILLRMCIGFVIMALAQPIYGFKEIGTKGNNSEIVLAIDLSNSMNTCDIEARTSRLEIAKRVGMQLMNELRGQRIGLVIFAGNSYVQLPITKDYSAAKLFVQGLETKMVSLQGTNVNSAIEKSLGMYEDENAKKLLIMLTDGEDHEGLTADVIDDIALENIRLLAVGIGTEQGGLIPADPDRPEFGFKTDRQGKVVQSRINRDFVLQLAKQAKGKALFMRTPFPNLSDILTEINLQGKGKLRDLKVEVAENHFRVPLLLALVVWLAAMLGPISKPRRKEE